MLFAIILDLAAAGSCKKFLAYHRFRNGFSTIRHIYIYRVCVSVDPPIYRVYYADYSLYRNYSTATVLNGIQTLHSAEGNRQIRRPKLRCNCFWFATAN